MASKALDLAVRKRNEVIALKEIEDTGPEKIHNDTDMATEVKTVPKMYTSVPVLLVVGFQCLENTQFDSGSISVLLNCTNDLNCDQLVSLAVASLNDFAECTLAKEFNHLVCAMVRCPFLPGEGVGKLTLRCEVVVGDDDIVSVVIVDSGTVLVGTLI